MPDRDPTSPIWDVPLGFIGIGAMVIVGGGAYTLGEFAFYGYEFLPYWPMLDGWIVGTTMLAAAFGTFATCLNWRGATARALPFAHLWRSGPGALAAAGILVALAIAYWAAHPQYQCAFMSAPFIGLLLFGGFTSLQGPIIHVLRELGRPAVALLVLLVLEAGLMFGIGEGLSIDYYHKGLEHFQKERRAEWSVAQSGRADLRIDYARQEIILRINAGDAGGPQEISRSLAGFCK